MNMTDTICDGLRQLILLRLIEANLQEEPLARQLILFHRHHGGSRAEQCFAF